MNANVRNGETKWVDVETKSGLKVTLSGRGAGVYSIVYKGKRLNLTLKNPSEYLNSPQFFGKTLARVAGRIPCHFEVDGKKLDLPEDVNGFCLHGGKLHSLSFQEFTPSIVKEGDKLSVVFFLLSKDGDCGFPGNVEVKVTYVFFEDKSEFEIHFDAVSDKDTPFSFSNHIYWDLSDDNDVSNETFYLNADGYGVDNGFSQLVLGVNPILPCLDFRTPTKLGEKLDVIEKTLPAQTIDHLFTFASVGTEKPQAILQNDKIKLSQFTDFDAMNIYVDSSLTKVSFLNGPDFLGKRRAIALEPQINITNREELVIKKNQPIHHFVRYVIEEK